MPEEVLDALVRQVMGGGASSVSFGWQGGEPTLMGLEFFERVTALQERYGMAGQSVANGLQTNGLLIDGAWARFLARYRFLVGLSVDGPDEVHDRFRSRADGRGTAARVRDAAKRLLDADVAVNGLVVLTAASVGRVAEIWHSLAELGLCHLQFIPCLEWDGGSRRRWAPYCATPEQLGEMLCELFDLWCGAFSDGGPTVFVRWFDALLYGYVGLEPPLCTLQERCGDGVVVEHNGDVYACDFYVEPRWRLGSLLERDLRELAWGARQREFGARKAALPEACRACRWVSRCRGGCPKDRDRALDNSGKDALCGAYRAFFAHADARLRRLAAALTGADGRRG